ncbi:MAG: class I SAM-dependent methyltransferase [Anaerotignum sp.]|nr:class I SAM-dependent methyltransferase [Anaerotignum sp.]
MAEKIKLEKNTVSETLVLPLWGRACCAKKYPDIFPDEEAEKMVAALDYDFSGLNYKEFVMMTWALRKKMLCDRAKEYLKTYPKATIINLGCGVDSCFSYVDNGKCHVINLDLPEVIAVREMWMDCAEREKNVAADAFDLSWCEEIETALKDGVFIISGGVFMYFEAEKLQNFFAELAERFPGGGICFDAENSKGVEKSNRVLEKSGNRGAKILFAVDDAEDTFRSWSSHFGEILAFDRLPTDVAKEKSLPLLTKIILGMGFKMGMIKFVEIHFQKE